MILKVGYYHLKNINFKYEDEKVLKDAVYKGVLATEVESNYCQFINLVDVNEGSITIDGINIQELWTCITSL
jgi:hypothetical protein